MCWEESNGALRFHYDRGKADDGKGRVADVDNPFGVIFRRIIKADAP